MFVRTKDGIYKVIEDCGDWYKVEVPPSKWEEDDNGVYYEDSKIAGFYKKDIIKQAETIEELCDIFVLKNGDVYMPYLHDIPLIAFMNCRKQVLERKTYKELYGSIWVGADLRAVAKMNEKGELELLWTLKKQKKV